MTSFRKTRNIKREEKKIILMDLSIQLYGNPTPSGSFKPLKLLKIESLFSGEFSSPPTTKTHESGFQHPSRQRSYPARPPWLQHSFLLRLKLYNRYLVQNVGGSDSLQRMESILNYQLFIKKRVEPLPDMILLPLRTTMRFLPGFLSAYAIFL